MDSHSPHAPRLTTFDVDEVRGAYRVRRGLSIPTISVIDRQGKIIEHEQRNVFRYNAQNGNGADIIFGMGTTGEWNRVENSERQSLIRIQVDEIHSINRQLVSDGRQPVEAWAGVTGNFRSDVLGNLELAIEIGADAAVIAPLSVEDLSDIVGFFQRDVSGLFDRTGRSIPVFLYDNADIAVNPRAPHIHTRDLKRISRLPFVSGIKVSAPRRVLGNYTKGALHYKERGEFGVYIGDAMLMFQVFRLDDGLIGRMREYWNRYLLHNELPVGVVSGPANVFPREWQRAWRACYNDDKELMANYRLAFDAFGNACKFKSNDRLVDKTIACLKHAMKLDGIIESDRVASGTAALSETEKSTFAEAYNGIKQMLQTFADPIWLSRP